MTLTDHLWQRLLRLAPYCDGLSDDERALLRTSTKSFVAHKTFSGAHGLRVRRWMSYWVGLHAALPALHLGLECYRDFREVILYPGDFVVRHEHLDEHGVAHLLEEERAGESWEHGPVVVSWDAAWSDPAVLIHEFAHKIDMSSGGANGFPPLPATLAPARWTQAFSAVYTRFCHAVDAEEETRLDPYAAESPAEFFAVLSEAFFLAPDLVAEDFPSLYPLLRDLFRQDPLQRLGATTRT